MAFDFKKEYKEFYLPKNKPEIVNVPAANFIAVRGTGNPNQPDGHLSMDIGDSITRFYNEGRSCLGSGNCCREKKHGLLEGRIPSDGRGNLCTDDALGVI